MSRVVSSRRPTEVCVRIPSRMDLAGGFTDIYHAEDGAVLLFPIIVGKRTRVTARSAPEHFGITVSFDRGTDQSISAQIAVSLAHQLGITISAEVKVESPIPSGSGLGSSSQITAAIGAALACLAGKKIGRAELARKAYTAETPLTSCGWQDQAPLVCGRCAFVTAARALTPGEVLPAYQGLALPEPILREIECRGLLMFTEKDHSSSSKAILDAVKKGIDDDCEFVRKAWDDLRNLAYEARDTLKSGGEPDGIIGRLAKIVAKNWAAECDLTNGAVAMDELTAIGPDLEKYGGYKLLGAGCGGFLFFLGNSPSATEEASKLLRRVTAWQQFRWRVARSPARIDFS